MYPRSANFAAKSRMLNIDTINIHQVLRDVSEALMTYPARELLSHSADDTKTRGVGTSLGADDGGDLNKYVVREGFLIVLWKKIPPRLKAV